jgi:hypothetical protein
MRDYYTDFLHNINSVNTLDNEVSKVSKGQSLDKKQGKKQPFDTFDTALPSVYQKNNYPKNNDELAEFKADYFHTELNRFIENGVAFDVSADGFNFIDAAQTLKLSDMEFLKTNHSNFLCHLQQSLLMKHLFSHSPEQLEDFAFEIMERESLLAINIKTPLEIHLDAVKDTTRKWFADLLGKKA